MPTYQKIPVSIQAFKLFDDPMPDWFMDEVSRKQVVLMDTDYVMIVTLEGVMRADAGDFVIQGVEGEIYPCKSTIFHKTYTLVSDDPTEPSK